LTCLDKLQSLYLVLPLITDRGLAELRAMTKLEDLRIYQFEPAASGKPWGSPPRIDVTDRGLEHLKRLPNLRIVDFAGTQVTREGAQALCDALPECLVSIETGEGETFFVSPDPPPPGYMLWGCYTPDE
jgi:hypothetical protein